MPTTSNLFCVPCRRFMNIHRNGVRVEEKMSGDRPYKIWSADQYVCPECGNAIVSGFANSPIAELYQPDYAKVLEQSKEQYILYREDGQ